MDNFISQLLYAFNAIKSNIPTTLMIIALLWVIHLINVLLNRKLNLLGVYPRHLFGLIGIPFFSFLHADFNHLFFNTIPLLALITFVLINGFNNFICVSIIIMLLSGVFIWLFGRRGLHIGASSMVMGYWGYLLVDAYQHPSIITLFLGIICIYYFGSLALNFFPRTERTSWEGHIFGFLAGLATVFLNPLVCK